MMNKYNVIGINMHKNVKKLNNKQKKKNKIFKTRIITKKM